MQAQNTHAKNQFPPELQIDPQLPVSGCASTPENCVSTPELLENKKALDFSKAVHCDGPRIAPANRRNLLRNRQAC
jgi:hypothetical protein